MAVLFGRAGLAAMHDSAARTGRRTVRYAVRLAFAELDNEAAGKRVFDIKLQGKIVAEKVDVFQQAGGRNKPLVKEFQGLDADLGDLAIEFVPAAANPGPDQLPILQGVEVVREQVLTLGFAVPLLLSNAQPEQAGRLVIANHKEGDFGGTLRVEAPPGFAVTPAQTQVRIPSGQRTTLARRLFWATRPRPENTGSRSSCSGLTERSRPTSGPSWSTWETCGASFCKLSRTPTPASLHRGRTTGKANA